VQKLGSSPHSILPVYALVNILNATPVRLSAVAVAAVAAATGGAFILYLLLMTQNALCTRTDVQTSIDHAQERIKRCEAKDCNMHSCKPAD
jgi:hypothetical protein